MKTIQIYDPPMCCSTGVCGTDVDPKLLRFAAALSFLQEQGVKVERYNPAQQPLAFAQNETVRAAMQKHGDSCLPLILVDGEVASRSIYPDREQLKQIAGLASGCCDSSTGCCP